VYLRWVCRFISEPRYRQPAIKNIEGLFLIGDVYLFR